MDQSILYVGIDLHEKESQLAVFDQGGNLLDEKRVPTKELASHLSSLPGEKRVAMEAVGFVYPVYDELSSLKDCGVTVANPQQAAAHREIEHEARQGGCKDFGGPAQDQLPARGTHA